MAGRKNVEKELRWRDILKRQADSGVSVREFCRTEGGSEPSFYAWRKKLGTRKKDGPRARTAARCKDPSDNGLRPDELTWHRANRSTILDVLRHPIYAGAYVYGRSKSVTTSGANGSRKTVQRRVGKDEWEVLIRDKVPAYITWEQWERNQQKLRENSTRFGFGVSRGASSLAGRVVCGKCGAGMSVHYRDGIPSFDCRLASMQYGADDCQAFNARWLEPIIEELVLQAFEPASIQLSMDAAENIEKDRARLEAHHKQSLDRATYDADVARRRYEEVDPSNRLVAAMKPSKSASIQAAKAYLKNNGSAASTCGQR